MCDKEATACVEAGQEAADVGDPYDPVNFHEPGAEDGVDHEIEDGGGKGAALSDSALGFEDPLVVPCRSAVQVPALPEVDNKPHCIWSHPRFHNDVSVHLSLSITS